jgi:tRNA pseudouridine38-40 synthase
MDAAAKMLLGTKDFKSFASAADKRTDSIRTILHCEVYSSKFPPSNTSHESRATSDDWVFVDIEADRFLYNMVRNIVGTLVEIGRGKWKPEKITEILNAKDRKAAGPIAPAQGLCLMWIKY